MISLPRIFRSLNFLTVILIIIACFAACFTYFSFSQTNIWLHDHKKFIQLLNIDLIILFLLAFVVALKLYTIWTRQRSDQAGAKLNRRFILIFSLFTITPAFIVAIFSGLLLNVSIQTWFDNRVKTALLESNNIAQAYLEEHKKVVSVNVVVMARQLSQDFSLMLENRDLFNKTLSLLTEERNLDEAIVFNSVPEVIARSKLSFLLEFETVSPADLRRAQTAAVLHDSAHGNRVRALYKIPNRNAYLLVGRIVDPAILKRMEEVKSTVSTYSIIEQHRQNVERYCIIIFIEITLLFLLCSIWVALVVASRIARPISALVTAADQIREGEFSVKVDHKVTKDEIGQLINAFNRMSLQISDQHENLMKVNQKLDERFQFIEDVFEGITAGIISIDPDYDIQLINSSALMLLGIASIEEKTSLRKIFPEMMDLIAQVDLQVNNPIYQKQLRIYRTGHVRTLLARLVKEVHFDQNKGYIITFDDVSELVSAQKKAAWSDVARRIAHEIRNPLTPIQLSAERLQKKYSKQILIEPEKFNNCIETIIRQVNHIGMMVKEFSNFARMPESIYVESNLIQLIKQIIDQEKQTNININYEFLTPQESFIVLIDSAQFQQVLTNIFQNAADAIHERYHKKSSNLSLGQIKTEIMIASDSYTLTITDNGTGLPFVDRETLTEPYVTKKDKGTGLGLAIVKRIVEDHGGTLKLEDAAEQGTVIILCFPIKTKLTTVEDMR